jgi:hypothetical protein
VLGTSKQRDSAQTAMARNPGVIALEGP